MVRRHTLTPMQRTFVKHMAATGDAAYAAAKAGYTSPDTQGPRNMQIRAVKESVYEAQMRRLEDEGAPVAVARLIKNAGNDSLPAPAQNFAAKTIMELLAKARDGQASGKEMSEMTIPELQAMAREAERNAMLARRVADSREGRIEEAQTLPIEAPAPGVFG